MREEAIAQQNAERISPARVRGRLRAAPFRFVHHVIMYKRGDVDELHDDRKIDMVRINLASGATGEKSQKWTKPFAATPYGIGNIAFERWIESRRLLRNTHFHLFEMRLNQPRHLSQRAETHSASARPG